METLKTFSKKPIEQLDVIKAVGVLVSLSGKHPHTFIAKLCTPFLLSLLTSKLLACSL